MSGARSTDVLTPLGLTGRVRLLPGPLADRVADATRVYTGLGVDSILKGFREQAGMSAPGLGLGGWASRTTEATFGQWVSGLARLAAAHDDADLRSTVAALVDGWAETLPPDGDARMVTYGWEKAACGLVDAAAFAGHRPALDVLTRISEAASRTFDRTRSLPTPTDRDGRRPHDTLEWYTLAENLYRGHLLSGEPALAELAAVWHYDAYWQRFAEAPAPGTDWDVPVWLHAYSHVNTFASVVARHDVTGDPADLDILRNAHDWAVGTQCYATGGYGPGEWSLPSDGSLGCALERRSDTAEITCGSWAAFKLCGALLRLTGEARYADWLETLVHSGVGATTPVEPDGRTPYYADYRLGTATKLPHWDAWPCCSGTYLQAVAQLHDLVFHRSADGIAVALTVPAAVDVDLDGTAVTVTQRTSFPAEDTATIRVDVERPVHFALRLRVPEWSTGLGLSLDGRATPHHVEDGWAVLRRTWQPGDQVEVRLGAGLRALPVDPQHPHRVAFAHGPVVLAQDAVFSAPLSAGGPLEVQDVDRLLVRDDDAPLAYRPAWRGAAEQPVGPFRPLRDVPERMPHRVYHDLDDPRVI